MIGRKAPVHKNQNIHLIEFNNRLYNDPMFIPCEMGARRKIPVTSPLSRVTKAISIGVLRAAKVASGDVASSAGIGGLALWIDIRINRTLPHSS